MSTDPKPQVASTSTVLAPSTRGEKAKSALITVRRFLEEKLTTDRPHSSHPVAGPSSSSHPHDQRTYGPDFLELFANKYMNTRRERGERRKLNIITGPQAENVYRKFVRRSLGDHDEKRPEGMRKSGPKPMVFAFASNEKDKKGIKFYKTWLNHKDDSRNHPPTKTQAHERRLDAEFDRVLGYLDTQFHRMSVASNISAVSLPFLRSVVLDGSRSTEEGASPKGPLRPTNPDSVFSGVADEDATSNEMQDKPLPPINISIEDEHDHRSLPDIVVSSAEGSSSPEAPTNEVANGISPQDSDQTPVKESLSVPLARPSGHRHRPQHKSKRTPSVGNSAGYHTDASEKSSLSGSSDHAHDQATGASGDVSEFTIVLLEEGKNYALDRRDGGQSESRPDGDAHEEVTPWWAHLGIPPPLHPRAPRLFNPSSDNVPPDVSPWWTEAESPSEAGTATMMKKSKKTKKSRTPDKSEYRSRPHPEVGSTTWKEYMMVDPVGYPHLPPHPHPQAPHVQVHHGVVYEHVEYEYPVLGHAPAEQLAFSVSSGGYYPSPVLYSVPYGSPVPSWGSSYLDVSSPMSDHLLLAGEDVHAFADMHGYLHPY